MRFVIAAVIACVSMALVMTTNDAGEKKPKSKIAEVMIKAMTEGGLLQKVVEGKANADEKAALVTLFTALHQSTPPRGDAGDWKEKTNALLLAAKKGDTVALTKAANCKACHTSHKPPKKD